MYPLQVMPTMFTADVKGFEEGLNETGVWHYDWPRNRLRNDFVIKQEEKPTPTLLERHLMSWCAT